MGYKHRWDRPAVIEVESFQRILSDFRLLIEPLAASGVKLGDAFGVDAPILSQDEICFNGRAKCGCNTRRRTMADYLFAGSDSDGLLLQEDWLERRCNGGCSYETFAFPRVDANYVDENGRVYRCVKTNRRPYDLAVTALLLIAKRYLGDELKIFSDSREAWWDETRDLCNRVLGYGQGRYVAEPWSAAVDHTDPRSRAIFYSLNAPGGSSETRLTSEFETEDYLPFSLN